MKDARHHLDQFFTPGWLAELIVGHYFADLRPGDTVLEPTCGDGAFLSALPDGIQGIGVEIDPKLAEAARNNSGHKVLVGDIRTVSLHGSVSAVIGNPPFKMDVVDDILRRAAAMLPEDGRAGFILPTYALQTPSRVLRYHHQWSIQADHIPRSVFPRLSKPLVFALFTKEQRRRLVGFAFYAEASAVAALRRSYRDMLAAARGSAWRKAVTEALIQLGGEASLGELYAEIEGARPTPNRFWREKVRQTVQAYCERVAPSRYRLPQVPA